MLRLIGFMIKLSFFAVVVLVLGHVVRWNGRTISDQVKTQMSHAERSPWVEKVKKLPATVPSQIRSIGVGTDNRSDSDSDEEIPSSERQKLRALIRELNGSR